MGNQVTQLPTAKCKLVYVRYVDGWVMALAGPYALAKYIKAKIIAWLKSELCLTLSQSKIRIVDPMVHPYIFLGFSIGQYRNPMFKWTEYSSGWRLNSIAPRGTTIRIPFQERVYSRLSEKGLIK